MENHTKLYDVGVVGLGVMGKNLALNIADNHYSVAAFDLDTEKVEGVVLQEKSDRASSKQSHISPRIHGCNNLSEMLFSLDKPRVLVLSVPAGAPVTNRVIDYVTMGIGFSRPKEAASSVELHFTSLHARRGIIVPFICN